MTNQPQHPEFVIVIDDEQATRQQIESLLTADDVRARSFVSIITFLDWLDYDRLPENIVVAAEINLPELGGFDLLSVFKADAVFLPTILMGRSMTVGDAAEAMHAGANYILQKPFIDDAFRAAIGRAAQSRQALGNVHSPAGSVRRRLGSLSRRQRELLIHVSKGRTNREIADQLSISQKTVELHRAAMMQKMGAATLAQLIRIAVECGDLLTPGVHNECA